MGDAESKQIIFCNQASLSAEELEHQPSHKPFDVQFILHARCTEVKLPQNLWEWEGEGEGLEDEGGETEVRCNIRDKNK